MELVAYESESLVGSSISISVAMFRVSGAEKATSHGPVGILTSRWEVLTSLGSATCCQLLGGSSCRLLGGSNCEL